MLRFSISVLMATCFLAPVGAAEGLAALFDTQSHDFGNVPIGPMLRHDFTIKNTTNQTLQIANLRVSCGCVTPSAAKTTIPPGETATVLAQMDSRRFSGAKSVTIFVLFSQPHVEEVRLVVSAFGRSDIAMNPETLNFGQMRKGTSPSVSTQIAFAAGSRILEASAESGYVQVSVKEAKQSANGLWTYELTAKMRPDIPVGRWYTDVWIRTDNNGRMRIPLNVEVEPSLTISPGVVEFDATRVGEPTKKPIVVKGAAPFRILDVKGGDGAFSAVDTTGEPKTTHLLMVTFKPGKEGNYVKNLEIVTDLKDEGKVQLAVKGTGKK
jgi:hypothetical protein